MGLPSFNSLACCARSLALRRTWPPWGTIPRFRRCLACRTAGAPLVVGLPFIPLTIPQDCPHTQLIARQRSKVLTEFPGLREGLDCQLLVGGSVFVGLAHELPHFILMQPDGVGVLSDELVHIQALDSRWASDPLLLPMDEDGHELLSPSFPRPPLGSGELSFRFGHGRCC